MMQLVNKRTMISKVRQVKLSTKQTVSDKLLRYHILLLS